MAKKVFILETKLSFEKAKRLTNFLELSGQYEITQNYTLADYIVTELKSPSRIMRMVKKSICPIIHINWLMESIPFEKLLDPLNYQINVSEARKQAIIDLSTRIPVRKLPRQYTWDQIAKKRSNRTSQETNTTLIIKSPGAQARSQFTTLYGSRAKYTKKHLVTKVTTLDNLKQDIMASVNISSSNHTKPLDNDDYSTVSIKKEETIINSVPLVISTADPTIKTSSKTKTCIKSDKQDDSFTRKDEFNKGKQTDLSLTPRISTSDNILKKRNHSSNHQEKEKVASSNELIGALEDTDFSITDDKKCTNKNNSLSDISYSITDNCNNLVEQTHPLSLSYHGSATESLNFSCSSISSIEDLDLKKYSISALLSL